jgi:hypothetical protein
MILFSPGTDSSSLYPSALCQFRPLEFRSRIGSRGKEANPECRKEEKTDAQICRLDETDGAGKQGYPDAPERIESAPKFFRKMGGKKIGFSLVMGEYDYVGIGECPSDKVAPPSRWRYVPRET